MCVHMHIDVNAWPRSIGTSYAFYFIFSINKQMNEMNVSNELNSIVKLSIYLVALAHKYTINSMVLKIK